MKKWWVKLLIVLAAVVALISLAVGISGAHSKNAVERYKDQLRAAGEKLDLKDLVPSPVDSDKNGRDFLERASVSLPKSGILSTYALSPMKMVASGKAIIASRQSEIIVEDEPRSTNKWADLDYELQIQAPTIDLLRQASVRPQMDFQLDFNQGMTMPLPHLAKFKQIAMLLSFAALADLHRGDTASAATNLNTLLLVINHWNREPILISQLVRIAMAQIAVPAQWEFLQSSNLTDAELAMLQHDWAEMQFVQPMESALLIERASVSQNIQQLRTSNSPSSVYTGWTGPGSSGGSGSGDWLDTLKDVGQSMKHRAADALWRSSWSYDDELSELQGNQILVEATRQIRTNGYFKDALADRDRKLATLGLASSGTNWLRDHLDDVFTSFLGGGSVLSTGKALERTLACEVSRNITITAIALKRYQLRHRSYPGSLSELVPEFLAEIPRDPVDGHLLRYQLLPDGNFQLYSIGSDNVDNGGDASPATGSKTFFWQRCHDWVWPHPATPQEIEFFRTNPPK